MERLGVSFSGGFQPPDIVDCVQLADELGYESAWMAEGHGGDQFSILTACALRTKNILLGTGITSVFVRSAPTIAMAAASVDHFSQGRFVLGLGTSHKVQVEPEHGLMFEKPIPRLRECVGIIRELLRKGEVSHRGDVYNIDNFDFRFEPLRREIPIYVAAVFPKMLEICGETAQGALMTWCTLEHAAMAATHVAEGAKRAGRSPEDVEVATSLPCAVGSLGEGAMEGLRTNIAKYAAQFPRYRKLMEQAGFTEELKAVRQLWKEGNEEEARRLIPTELIDKIALVGSADQCRRKLDEYRRAGITQPIISPRVSGDNPKEEAMQIIRACAPR